jgi:type IV secretory pathway VirB2 component (pilin)
MSAVASFLVPVAILAVAGVLFAGLFNMMKGGSANRSQLLMRWRVGLQFVALIIIMFAIWLKSA